MEILSFPMGVERWSAELAGKRRQRGMHRPVAEPNAGVMSFIDAHKGVPKPSRWVKSAGGIPASARRLCLKMDKPGAIEDD